MAKIGMEYIVIGELAPTSTSAANASYTKSKYLGPASTFNGNPTANDVKDYGDDRTVETDVMDKTVILQCSLTSLTTLTLLLPIQTVILWKAYLQQLPSSSMAQGSCSVATA